MTRLPRPLNEKRVLKQNLDVPQLIDQLISLGVECFSRDVGDAVRDACGGVALVGKYMAEEDIDLHLSTLSGRSDGVDIVDRISRGMFGDSKEKEASPPAYPSSSPPEPGPSTTSTSRGVTVTLTSPGPYLPGSTINAELSIPEDVRSSIQGGIHCSVEGKSSVEIMGKQRYQKAQMLNVGLGGNAVPISGREEHMFASHAIGISPQSGAVPITLRIPDRRTCICPGEEDGIMPSLGWKGSLGDRNRVIWKLKVFFARRGILKRDIKLSIEIPVSLPPPPSSKSPLVASDTKPLSYDSSSTPPSLQATFQIFPSSPSTPRRIPFRLSLSTTPHPQLLDINDETLRVSVGLCKHTWTKGIDTSLGDPGGHDFPGIIVGSLKPNDARPGGGPGRIGIVDGEGGMAVQGEYEVEEDMFTARGCGLRLSWSLQAQVRWKKLSAPMVLSQVVYLPHFTSP